MLTFDDIRAVPLLSLLAEEQWEALEQTSSDIHLAVGEFAVPEGGEPAFYAVLSGRIEVVKMIDGVERRLGGVFRVDLRRGAARAGDLLSRRLPRFGAVAGDARRNAPVLRPRGVVT